MGWRSIDRAQVDRLMAATRQAPVGGVPVGHGQAADGSIVPDEGVETLTVDVHDARQAASRWLFPVLHLYGSDHENLADWTSSLSSAFRFVLPAERYVRLVDLDHAS